jgi:hypothetical protein
METHNVREKGGDRLHSRLGSTSDQNERSHSCMETCRMCAPQQQPAGKKAESARTLDGRHLQTLAEGRVRKGGQKGTRTHTHTRARIHTHTHGTLATMTLVKRTSMHRNTTRTQERWSSITCAAERKEASAIAVIWACAALVIPIHARKVEDI